MNILTKLTIVIPRLRWLVRMASAAPSTMKLVNSVTSDYVDLFIFAIFDFATSCLPIRRVPCSDGWRRTRWETIHMMQGLLISSIPQCTINRHEGSYLDFFPAIERFEPSFIEAHLASIMIFEARSFKSQMKTRWFFRAVSDFGISIILQQGGQYIDYRYISFHRLWIMQDTRPKIVNTLLKLISRR